ncbi:hypothetical protein [Aliivibrio salmonicida]|uniref:hypothetical protein n=1 Tax=Aliivibrio salmonicida TaxID=40269 RepID=UPI003D0F0205
MKINTHTLATLLLGSLLSGSVLAEKVTYDKAVADSKAYQDSLPHYKNATTGLSSAESDSRGIPNQMGRWVNLGGVSLQHSGGYTTMLTPSALNTGCIKGDKGFIPKKTTTYKRECTYWQQIGSNGSMHCRNWENIATHSYHDNGYKAECR